uniref:Uncharacterized protein n=1 Tax=Anguilla anguilla TaxID=7936 RepID=A0A0E9STU8_ANGAN
MFVVSLNWRAYTGFFMLYFALLLKNVSSPSRPRHILVCLCSVSC